MFNSEQSMSVNNYCSPKRSNTKDGKCLTKRELEHIASDINISGVKIPINTKAPKKKLYTQLESAFKPFCGTTHNKEYCWIEQPVVSPSTKSLVKDNFRPKKPISWYENRRKWLNTFDIQHVMTQYEQLYKDFTFLGVHPIDFQKTYPGNASRCIGVFLCSFDINKHIIEAKKKRFALVLNLDRHNQSGSHWVALFGDLDPRRKTYGIYYYDSVAHPPHPDVVKFMNSIIQQEKTLRKRPTQRIFEKQYNVIQKQTKNTECGVFSMVFITQMLKAKYTFRVLCSLMKTDDAMNEIRDILYRPSVFK